MPPNSSIGEFNPADFILPPDATPVVEPQNRRHQQRQRVEPFIFRLPLNWLWGIIRLDKQYNGHGNLVKIALAIQYLNGLRRGTEIRITPEIRERFGISRAGLYRGLKLLHEGGYVTCVQKQKTSPLVTSINLLIEKE